MDNHAYPPEAIAAIEVLRITCDAHIHEIEHLEAELAASRSADDEALKYLATPENWLLLRERALRDAPLYAALKVIRIQAQELLDLKHNEVKK